MKNPISQFIFVPDKLEASLNNENILMLPLTNQELYLDEKVGLMRSMNRAGLLLANCSVQIEDSIRKRFHDNPNRTTIYCATEQSVGNHENILNYCHFGLDEVARFKKYISPKWLLQSSIGLVASSLSILLGIEGGVHTFHHPQFACHQALAQAKIDLRLGLVDLAIVCAVSSGEDPLMVHLRKAKAPNQKLSEGAGILVFSSAAQIDFEPEYHSNSNINFGIANPLIQYILSRMS